MNSMNDERFFDLAMKVIVRHATDVERAELDALLAREPELKAEFERLQMDVRTAKDALPLVEATQATAYLATFQQPRPASQFVVRTAIPPGQIVPAVRSDVRDIKNDRKDLRADRKDLVKDRRDIRKDVRWIETR